jgi:hypothetical protein
MFEVVCKVVNKWEKDFYFFGLDPIISWSFCHSFAFLSRNDIFNCVKNIRKIFVIFLFQLPDFAG